MNTPTMTENTQPVSVQVSLRGLSEFRPAGQALVRTLNSKMRRKKALKWLGLCWGGAVISVFLPILHFILVPGLLFIGPFIAFAMYQTQSEILPFAVPCPKCQASVPIAKSKETWPLQDICVQCKSEITIDRTAR